jgi:hypothetical protein
MLLSPTQINQAKCALDFIRSKYQNGAYRAIRNPEGEVSLWAIDGNPRASFSMSFVDKGRVYTRVEDVSEDFLKSFLEYVRNNVK